MRCRNIHNGLTVNTIAGTHVVVFGMDLAEPNRTGFRGFGILRSGGEHGETVWLRGIKTFEATEPHPTRGELFRSNQHPFQSFQWADYSVKPGQDYTYTIVALYGSAIKLEPRIEVTVKVRTEVETGPTHSVFFNRGSIATQEYARRFENKRPSEVGPSAYEWLSKGLVEALIQFIGRAGKEHEIFGAVYEFQWPTILEALQQAHKRGAKVQVLFDDIGGNIPGSKGPAQKNRDAIQKAGIGALCQGRGNSTKIMHNKFFVLTVKGKPQAVWTGSTNLTENGLFGHSNLGHLVEDPLVAQNYLDYWHRLATDPRVDVNYRAANTQATDIPPNPWENGTTTIFSPRGTTTNLDSLNWYADIAASAKAGLFMTFAFGMHRKFKDVYLMNDNVLRMALLEKEGNSPQNMVQDREDIQKLRNRPNVVLAIGNRIKTNAFDRWLTERDSVGGNVHVHWIHTKYMLVDPLGPIPIVVTGSGNFSQASISDNDENMLVIRGDQRIADIYFGEYIRLYAHYAFREAVKRQTERLNGTGPSSWRPQYLIDSDDWFKPHFDPQERSGRYARREYFANPMMG